MRSISIIHPSRSRPYQAHETVKKWLKNSDHIWNIEYIISIDSDDPKLDEYKGIIVDDSDVSFLVGENKTAIEAINNAAKHATGDILIVVSDDFDCPEHWDTDLLALIGDRQDFVAKTKDGAQPWIITLPIMDCKYYSRFGYVYYPGFRHMFADTEMTHVGDLLGKTIHLDITFPHRHYTQRDGQPKDEINVKNDATWNQGEQLYLERLKTNFGLSEVKEITLPAHHAHWLKSKGALV